MKDFIIPDDRDMGTPARTGAPVTLTIDGFEITVPGFIAPVTRLADLLPQPVRDRIFVAMVPDQVAQVRADARAGYEEAAFTTSRAGRGQGWAASAE